MTTGAGSLLVDEGGETGAGPSTIGGDETGGVRRRRRRRRRRSGWRRRSGCAAGGGVGGGVGGAGGVGGVGGAGGVGGVKLSSRIARAGSGPAVSGGALSCDEMRAKEILYESWAAWSVAPAAGREQISSRGKLALENFTSRERVDRNALPRGIGERQDDVLGQVFASTE